MYEDTGERPACNHIARKAPLHSTSFMYSRGRLNERDWNPSSFEHLDVCSAGFRISMRSRRERPASLAHRSSCLGSGSGFRFLRFRIPFTASLNLPIAEATPTRPTEARVAGLRRRSVTRAQGSSRYTGASEVNFRGLRAFPPKEALSGC